MSSVKIRHDPDCWLHVDQYEKYTHAFCSYIGKSLCRSNGALASAVGYVIWYRVLREMSAITASAVQLSAPVIAAVGGIILLDEALSLNLLIASALILGGITLVLRKKQT